VVSVKDGLIQNLLFSGNVLCSPVTALEETEGFLKGAAQDEGQIREKAQAVDGNPNYRLSGTTPDNLVRLMLEGARKAG